MPKFAVTGASGKLGQLVLQSLISKGASPADVVAIVRDPGKNKIDGVEVRTADYDDAQTFIKALDGVDTLLLISASVPGNRLAQHRAVIDAAKLNGVGRIIYTSAPHADTSELVLAPEHKATEELIKASGIPFTLLRNSWYTENYTDQLRTYLATGAIVHAAKDGKVSGAPRVDYAEAAAVALINSGHENKTYELGGKPEFTMDDLAAAVTEATGKSVVAKLVSVDELVEILRSGLDEATAGFVAALDEATARGDLVSGTDDLQTLLGRESTLLVDAVKAAL